MTQPRDEKQADRPRRRGAGAASERHAVDATGRRAQRLATVVRLIAAAGSGNSGTETPRPSQAPRGRRGGSARPSLVAGSAARGARGAVESNPSTSAAAWQRRQVEILLRIDDNLRRVRQACETHRQEPAVFTEPEY